MSLKKALWNKSLFTVTICAVLAACAAAPKAPLVSPATTAGGPIVMKTAAAQDPFPFKAAARAAAGLRAAMEGQPVHAVLVVDSFDSKALKKKVLAGVALVFPRDRIFGGATYGSFSQSGCLDENAVGLLAIGGSGIGVATALEEELGVGDLSMETDGEAIKSRLDGAGRRLAARLPRSSDDRLIILIADAHSPKNQYLIEGMHPIVGDRFPITGGSVNKNAGQTFVYYRGGMYPDAAVALMLSGDFNVALSGRRAQTNERVIATARDGAAEARKNLRGRPVAMFAFNCAGRKGKLDRLEDELEAIQGVIGKDVPIFGCYCAGEYGPVDVEDKNPALLSSGRGWHVMCTLLGRE